MDNTPGHHVPVHGVVISDTRVFLMVGKHVVAVDTTSLLTGKLIVLFEVSHDDIVRTVAPDVESSLFATGGDDKKLRLFQDSQKLWEADTLKKVTQLCLVPTKMDSANAEDSRVSCFLRSLLFADKFGSVYRACAYDANVEAKEAVPWLKSNVMGRSAQEETPILLGHYSTITQLLPISSGQHNYIVTAEKDEKIRVTSFPETYNIVAYCLGHSKFVSALDFYVHQHKVRLISGGGDGRVICWDLESGRPTSQLDLAPVLVPSFHSKHSVLSSIPDRSPCVRRLTVWPQKRAALCIVEEYNAILVLQVDSNDILHVSHQVSLPGSPLDLGGYSFSDTAAQLFVAVAAAEEGQQPGQSSIFNLVVQTSGDTLASSATLLCHTGSLPGSDPLSLAAYSQHLKTLSPTSALRKVISTRWAPKGLSGVDELVPEAKRARIE